MDPFAADLALAETLAQLRRTSAAIRSAMAVPLRLLAVAWLGLIAVVLAVGRNHLGPFVAAALLAVTAVAALRYRRIAIERGVRARLWPWLAVALVALAGGATASRMGTEQALPWLNVAGPFLVNALALLALARFIRSAELAGCAVVIVLIAAVCAATMHGDAAVAAQLGVDATTLLATSARLSR